MQKAAVALQALVVLTFGTSAWGVPLEVSINSASLKDTIVALAIDLVDSSAAPSSLTVSPLGGNAQQTATASLTGGASGSVAAGFTLQDSAFFNEVAILSGLVTSSRSQPTWRSAHLQSASSPISSLFSS